MALLGDVHTIGTHVWVKDDEESWRKGDVAKLEEGFLVIKAEGGKTVTCKPDEAPIQNPDTRGGVEVRSQRAAPRMLEFELESRLDRT